MFHNRHIYKNLTAELGEKEIVILTGSRQVGKTTLLRMLEKELKERNKPTIFLDLDLTENLESFGSLSNFLGYLKINGINPKKRAFVFVDEFQHSPNATAVLKNISDHYPNLKIFVN